VTIHCSEQHTAGARLFTWAFFDESLMEKALCIETARLLQKCGTEFAFPGWRNVDKLLEHVDRMTHATTDSGGAAAILELLETCGARRVGRSKQGLATKTERADSDQVPRLLARFRAASPLSA
jgi:hypothetical protein